VPETRHTFTERQRQPLSGDQNARQDSGFGAVGAVGEPEDRWLSHGEAARYLGMSARGLYQKRLQGDIPFAPLPGSDRVRYSLLTLHRLMKSREHTTPRRGR
jgi:hypothetical protein